MCLIACYIYARGGGVVHSFVCLRQQYNTTVLIVGPVLSDGKHNNN